MFSCLHYKSPFLLDMTNLLIQSFKFVIIHCCLVISLTLTHNSRENSRNAKLIIDMQGKTTIIKDPSQAGDEGRKVTLITRLYSLKYK